MGLYRCFIQQTVKVPASCTHTNIHTYICNINITALCVAFPFFWYCLRRCSILTPKVFGCFLSCTQPLCNTFSLLMFFFCTSPFQPLNPSHFDNRPLRRNYSPRLPAYVAEGYIGNILLPHCVHSQACPATVSMTALPRWEKAPFKSALPCRHLSTMEGYL